MYDTDDGGAVGNPDKMRSLSALPPAVSLKYVRIFRVHHHCAHIRFDINFVYCFANEDCLDGMPNTSESECWQTDETYARHCTRSLVTELKLFLSKPIIGHGNVGRSDLVR